MSELDCLSESTPYRSTLASFSFPLPSFFFLLGAKLAFTPRAAVKHDNTIHPFTCLIPSLCHSPRSHKPCMHSYHLLHPYLSPSFILSLSLSLCLQQPPPAEWTIFSISSGKWKCSVGGRHRCVLVGEVSHRGLRCAFSQLHSRNQPDAPQGDERASAAVSLLLLLLHASQERDEERRRKKENTLRLQRNGNHNNAVEQEGSGVGKEDRQYTSLWSSGFPFLSLLAMCGNLTTII